MSKIIHRMIRVLGLKSSLKFYADCLGLVPSRWLDCPSFSLICIKNFENDAKIELTWNKDCTEPHTHTHGDGDGYGHVGVYVPDVPTDRARLLGLGYAPLDIKEFKADDGTTLMKLGRVLYPRKTCLMRFTPCSSKIWARGLPKTRPVPDCLKRMLSV